MSQNRVTRSEFFKLTTAMVNLESGRQFEDWKELESFCAQVVGRVVARATIREAFRSAGKDFKKHLRTSGPLLALWNRLTDMEARLKVLENAING